MRHIHGVAAGLVGLATAFLSVSPVAAQESCPPRSAELQQAIDEQLTNAPAESRSATRSSTTPAP